MLINRNNYEEFFLLYVDHELTAAERKAVDNFVKENVDLGEELRHLQHAKMQPDHSVIFENKKSLLKQPSEKYFINELNYEEFFVLFVDGELSEDGRNAVQEFVLLHPQLKQELDLLQQTCLVPDLDIIFEGKEDLFRKEEDTKFVPLPWFRMSAAALVLLLSGLLVFKYAGVRNEGANRPTDRAVADHQAPSTEKKSTATVTPSTVDSLQHIARVEKDPSTTKVKEQGMVTKKKSIPASQLKEDLPEQSIASLPNVNKETNHLVPVPETTNGQKAIVADQLTASNDPTPKILVPITDHAAQADLTDQMAIDNGSRLIAYNEPNADRDNEVSFLNAPSTGKNKMRGFFRKVTRVFEKRTGIDDENSKSTVLVGNFQIALK